MVNDFMKRMYKQPIVEAAELQGGAVMQTVSPVVNNNMTEIPGGSVD